MHAYFTKSFQRQASSDNISDEDCREAIRRAEKGLVDADLGKGLIKQRIPRGNQGAARGSRAIIFYKRGRSDSIPRYYGAAATRIPRPPVPH